MRLMGLHFVLFVLPGFLIGLTAHEFAHAWTASLLGDDYPRRRGRVSLNPLRHLSLLGTLAILVLPIGWAKPVEVNIYNFKRPKRDFLLSSLAGPAANLLLVAVCLLATQFTRRSFAFGPGGETYLNVAHELLRWAAVINSVLAALNLLPIPPLDGSKIWPFLFPRMQAAQSKGTVWLCILVLLALAWTGSLFRLIGYVIAPAASLIPPTDSIRVRVHIEVGIALFNEDRFAEAEEHFSEAIALNPDSHEALAWRAAVRDGREDYAGALEDIRKALKLEHRNANYHLQAADYLDALGHHDQARKHRLLAHQIRPRPASRPASAPATRAATQPTSTPTTP